MRDFNSVTAAEIRSAVFPEVLQISGTAPVSCYFAGPVDGLLAVHILTFAADFNWTPAAKSRLVAFRDELHARQELLLVVAEDPEFSELAGELLLTESPHFCRLTCAAADDYQTTIDGTRFEALRRVLQEIRWGGIVFKGPVPGLQGVNAELMKDHCWKCGQPMLTVTGLVLPDRQLAAWDNEDWLYYNCLATLGTLPDRYALALEAFARQLRLRNPLITPVEYRYSHTTESSYWAAVCPHCDALRGDFYVQEARMNFLFDRSSRRAGNLQYHGLELDVDRTLIQLLNEALDGCPHMCFMGWTRDHLMA